MRVARWLSSSAAILNQCRGTKIDKCRRLTAEGETHTIGITIMGRTATVGDFSTHAFVLITHVRESLQECGTTTSRATNNKQHLPAKQRAREAVEQSPLRFDLAVGARIQHIGPRFDSSPNGRGFLNLQSRLSAKSLQQRCRERLTPRPQPMTARLSKCTPERLLDAVLWLSRSCSTKSRGSPIAGTYGRSTMDGLVKFRSV